MKKNRFSTCASNYIDCLRKEKVCRNTRCAFFFFIDYKNRFIFFKLRYFEDFFGLCVRNI